MPIPLIAIAGIAAVGGITAGGYTFGREVGEKTGDMLKVLAGSVLVYMAYKAVKK